MAQVVAYFVKKHSDSESKCSEFALVTGRQHYLGSCGDSFPADSRHSIRNNCVQLKPTSFSNHAKKNLFIQSLQSTRKEAINISVQFSCSSKIFCP